MKLGLIIILITIMNLCSYFIGYEISKPAPAIAVLPCNKKNSNYITIKGPHWGFSNSWYEGTHQGGGSGDGDEAVGTHLPPPDPPAIMHHKDEVAISLPDAQAELQNMYKQAALCNCTFDVAKFAFSMPEYPKAKPGSKKAAFDNWEDILELSTGFFGQALGGGVQGRTLASFLKTI